MVIILHLSPFSVIFLVWADRPNLIDMYMTKLSFFFNLRLMNSSGNRAVIGMLTPTIQGHKETVSAVRGCLLWEIGTEVESKWNRLLGGLRPSVPLPRLRMHFLPFPSTDIPYTVHLDS